MDAAQAITAASNQRQATLRAGQFMSAPSTDVKMTERQGLLSQ